MQCCCTVLVLKGVSLMKMLLFFFTYIATYWQMLGISMLCIGFTFLMACLNTHGSQMGKKIIPVCFPAGLEK